MSKSIVDGEAVLLCQGARFPVSRDRLCSQSSFSRKYYDELRSPSDLLVIPMDGFKPDVVKRVADFVNTNTYDDIISESEHVTPIVDDQERKTNEEPETDGETPKPCSAIQVHAAAEHLKMKPLQELAGARFEEWLKENWSSLCLTDSWGTIYSTTGESARLQGICTKVATLQHISESKLRTQGQGVTKDTESSGGVLEDRALDSQDTPQRPEADEDVFRGGQAGDILSGRQSETSETTKVQKRSWLNLRKLVPTAITAARQRRTQREAAKRSK